MPGGLAQEGRWTKVQFCNNWPQATWSSVTETIFFTHQPTWDYCQQLLQILFTSEEREQILWESAKPVLEPNGQPTIDPARIQHVLPYTRSPWDPNIKQGKEALDQYHQHLLQGLRSATRKPTNLPKPPFCLMMILNNHYVIVLSSWMSSPASDQTQLTSCSHNWMPHCTPMEAAPSQRESGLQRMAKQVSAQCHICAQVNPGPSKGIYKGRNFVDRHWGNIKS
ncbi:uncharacterized protein LOC118610798 [Rousettus aegyptiacus]|uniref:uncharacterized protein LOC118610798 n=1 Tax=Rousettus aegyptiacus TaxID=9407 RepID=UPI00168CE59B|nr:uncharacterized protein LOC118610798 [Rousettus aegyptiacus]